MKKGFATLGLLLVLVCVGFPFFKGIVLENVVRQSVEDINLTFAGAGQDVTIEIQSYNRRYSDSIIEWKLNTGTFKELLGVSDIIFVDRVHHGYLKSVSFTSLEKNTWFKKNIGSRRNLNDKNPVTIATEYSLLGDIESNIDLAGFSIKNEKEVTQVKSGSLNIAFKKQQRQIFFSLSWEGLVIPGKQVLDNIRVAAQMNAISDYIWSGTVSFSADTITSDDSNHSFEIKHLITEYVLEYKKEPSTVSIGITAGMDHLSTRQLDIKDAEIQFNIKHLDAKGFEEWMAVYSRVGAQLMEKTKALKDDPDAITKEIQNHAKSLGREMIGRIERFLRQGLEICVSNLHAQLPQGEISADIVLGLKKKMTLPGFFPILIRPSHVMDIFSLKSDIQIPYTLIGYQQRLLLPLIAGMQTGLFVTQGGNLVHQARIRDGKLFLNQKEVVLE